MSDAIQATTYDGSTNHVPAHNYTIQQDANGQVRLDTSNNNDVVELIWNEDGSLTIVINGETAVWLTAEQAEDVLIVTNGGDDDIFVTGDTPSGNKLRLHGGDGNDDIVGSDGIEQLEGGKGSDRLWGMGGNDTLYSKYTDDSRDGAVDYLYGGDGDDQLHGRRDDQSHGNAGTDQFSGGILFGGPDDLNYTGGLANLETDDEQSAPAPTFASNADNVRYASGPTSADTPPAADSAEPASEPVEPEGSEPESAADKPSASESDATAVAPSPELPSTLPGGDTPAGQLFHFHDQLTGFYADEISQALDNTQTYAENAQTAADSGDTEAAQQWARMALLESARADKLLLEAQARLGAAEQQLSEVLNDPDATDAEKAMAQEQYDEAKLAVETAESQATEAAGFAEEARLAAGLSEDDDGSVPSADAATPEPGAEGTESEAAGATPGAQGTESEAAGVTPGAEGSEPEADGEEAGSEGAEAPGAAAPEESESSEDPYDQAMDNASEGTNRQESDRRSRGRSGNFLVAMAEAMGLMQAKFLGNAMKHLDTMDSLSAETIPEGDANAERQHREAFLIAQSKFQAEMQMFNIVSQASATALRSTGEGMAAVVRKN